MQRVAVILVAFALVAGACDGSSTDEGPPPDAVSEAVSEPVPVDELPLAELPAYVRAPDGDPRSAAASVAADVRASGDAAPVLTALIASGFPVLQADGELVTADSVAGVAIPHWEALIVMAPELRAEGGVLLSDLGAALTEDVGDLELVAPTEGLPFADLILADIQDSVDDESPTTQFWASFIVELGRQRAEPVDILTATDPAQVELDPLQVQWILRKVADDLVLRAEAAGEGPRDLLPAGGASPSPCQLTGTQSWVVVGVEEVETRGVKGIVKMVSDAYGGGAKDLAATLKYSQILLDLTKFVVTYAALTVDTSIDRVPLDRTRFATPRTGDDATLRFGVSFELGDAATLNCFRLAFSSIGLKFSLPNNGAAKGVDLDVVGLEGFVQGPSVAGRIVQFFGGNPSKLRTDQSGTATMGVQGFGQKEEMPEDANRVEKRAAMRILVQVKDGDLAKDLFDSAKTGEGLGIPNGDPPAPGPGVPPHVIAAIKTAMELLYRTRWLSPYRFEFPVRDWAYDGRILGGVTHIEKTTYTGSTTGHSRTQVQVNLEGRLVDDRWVDEASTYSYTKDERIETSWDWCTITRTEQASGAGAFESPDAPGDRSYVEGGIDANGRLRLEGNLLGHGVADEVGQCGDPVNEHSEWEHYPRFALTCVQPDGKSIGGQVSADGKSYDMSCSGRLQTAPGATTTWEQSGTLTLSE